MTTSPEPSLSPAKAVLWGHVCVTVPALATVAVGAALWFALYGGAINGLLYVFVGISVAQLWSSIAVRRWRAWVRRSGADQERTRVLARRTGLVCRKRFFQRESDASAGRGRRIIRLLAPSVTTLVLGVFIWLYLGPITALLYIRWQGRTHPEMWVVPTPLPQSPARRLGGRKFAYFGYEFETPWSETTQERVSDSSVVLNFSNQTAVMIWNPTQTVDELKALTGTGATREAVRSLFGAQATSSNYALVSKILYSTPSDVSLLASRREMMANPILLTLKPMWTGMVKSGVCYSFETEWFRGFPTR